MKDEGRFVYVVHIAATPEKVWEALTTGEFTRHYWAARTIESDWKVGSPVKMTQKDGSPDWEGEVLESDPPKVLSYTFADRENGTTEPASRVRITLTVLGTATTLKLVHDRFPDGKVDPSIEQGWPAILSSLKSLLERGEPLDFGARLC